MKKFILLFLPLFLITACKQNFLDTQIRSAYDDEIFWTSGPNNLRAFGMGVYNYLKHFNRFNNNAMLASATDEADHATFSEMQRFNTGAWNAFTNPDDVWDDYYKGIRHANCLKASRTCMLGCQHKGASEQSNSVATLLQLCCNSVAIVIYLKL
jgi:hypothetical protein